MKRSNIGNNRIIHKLLIDALIFVTLFCAGVLVVDSLLPGTFAQTTPPAILFAFYTMLLVCAAYFGKKTTAVWTKKRNPTLLAISFVFFFILLLNALYGISLLFLLITAVLTMIIVALFWYETVSHDNPHV